ncbi:tetratricopeptide repeat protein [Actinomyces sp. zg-332]|uniref:tetratricopeptide repeat protein n=1 Tax=Actinomyces sp. zg-332 TaxID=2708340 RepID=UPI001421DE47|nr:tetratricopeptide repeat protein [Actinomyces sp. zg-332]QPK93837.1 tetratricopeptide repeat protein [Actinomyces sp. zg-332]
MEANFRGAFDLSKLVNEKDPVEQNANSEQGNLQTPVASTQQTQAGPVFAGKVPSQGSAFGIDANPQVPVSLDIDDTMLEVAVNQSTKYPIILLVWSAHFEQSKEFVEVFDKIAAEYNGRFQLLKVNIDENPLTQKIFNVETVPFVTALINGGMAPLFTGQMEEDGLREVVDKVLAACLENGVVGTAEYLPAVEVETPEEHRKAMEAFEQGDYATARAAWELALRKDPKDQMAKVGLADLRLRERLDENMDFEVAIEKAKNAAADDFEAKFAGADAMLVMGQVQDSLDTLLSIVLHGDEQTQEEARQRLLDAFEMLGPIDEVAKARRILASYLI